MSDDRITITVRENGSLFIAGTDMGRVRLVDHTGTEISTEGRKAISLCRCGASSKKPFCDGTHSKIGFQGAEAARAIFDAGRQQATSPGTPEGGPAGAPPAPPAAPSAAPTGGS
jgi:3-phenylpropionate/trans-cinnamate dioxygenase ferredoxin subunit